MGGIGTAVKQCAAALAAAGHDVHVFTPAIGAELLALAPAGVRVHEVDDLATRVHRGSLPAQLAAAINGGGEGIYRLALGWLLCAAVIEAHREKPFDVVETPEVEALGLPLMLDEHFDAPVVTHFHCCTAIAHDMNETAVGAGEKLIHELEFATIGLGDGVCAPTRAVLEQTRRFTIIPQEVSIVPHAYECGDRAFSPPPRGPILFIGRIERLKGADVIGRALTSFLAKRRDARFRFVGPDTPSAPGGGSMRQFVRSLLAPTVADRVEFTGEVPARRIDEELAACSFCVQPSLAENFSMTCCEAMAAGRTVIVGGGTGSVEVLGEAGMAADPRSPEALAEAMERLWMDRALLERHSRAAYERIRREFAPARIAALREKFYGEVILNFQMARRVNASPLLRALCAMTGNLAGVYANEQSPGARLLRIMEELRDRTGRPARVMLYGAGKHSARLLAERGVWEAGGHAVSGFIDDHPRSPTYLDLPVESLAAVRARLSAGKEVWPIVLSTDTYEDQFWAQTQTLRDQGVAVFRLYGRAA
jgi:glycosyltransferase involved in cell wall biosynthesis